MVDRRPQSNYQNFAKGMSNPVPSLRGPQARPGPYAAAQAHEQKSTSSASASGAKGMVTAPPATGNGQASLSSKLYQPTFQAPQSGGHKAIAKSMAKGISNY
ncbi:hypothetical protein ACP70R_018081 [Stipagrostis hirtigluma subsp. patula]